MPGDRKKKVEIIVELELDGVPILGGRPFITTMYVDDVILFNVTLASSEVTGAGWFGAGDSANTDLQINSVVAVGSGSWEIEYADFTFIRMNPGGWFVAAGHQPVSSSGPRLREESGSAGATIFGIVTAVDTRR